MKMLRLLVVLLITFLAGFIGQLFTTPSIPTWYAALNKPVFNPPNWIFAPVWTTLYTLMAVSAWLIWNKGLDNKDVKAGLKLFCLQLALNSLWSIIFFGLHLPWTAFVEIVFLGLVIFATIKAFSKVSQLASWLLIPYFLWVCFASVLNLTIVLLN